MASRLSKLDRISESQDVLENVDFGTIAGELQTISEAAERITESLNEAAEAFAEAQGFHEEREWDARNDALANANEAVETLSTSLDELEEGLGSLSTVEEFIEPLRGAVGKARGHLDNLIEA
jgi:uncharacterized phage infection (PIP) family protein YhgE